MKPLILCIIPGLFSEEVDAAKPETLPQWCTDLRGRVFAAIDPAQVFIANYTNPNLPEWLAAIQGAAVAETKMAIVGHSDGGACIAWMLNHIVRENLPLHFAMAVFLDRVQDVIRHGIIDTIPRSTVDTAIQIHQANPALVHANLLTFDDGTKLDRYDMAFFGQSGANHQAVAESDRVQAWIVAQLKTLVSGE